MIQDDDLRRLNRALARDRARANKAPTAAEARYETGTRDILPCIGLVLALGPALIAMWMILGPWSGAGLAFLGWALSEHWARKRRRAGPSMILFGAFTIGWTMCALMIAQMVPPALLPPSTAPVPPLIGLIVAGGAALGCVLYWLRFSLPFAFAALVVASLNMVVHVVSMIVSAPPVWAAQLALLVSGVALFAFAVWWDMTDVHRRTIRSDVAFWLHCLAGFQIAGPSYRLVAGVSSPAPGWSSIWAIEPNPLDPPSAALTLLIFGGFCLVALAVDRRSLIVCSLLYVFAALVRLGIGGSSASLASAFMLGLGVVALCTWWSPLRQSILGRLPPVVRAQLPRMA